MLSSADTSLSEIAQKLLEKNLPFGFLVPTENALKRSIIDAHDSFRSFLKQNNIHCFKDQKKGTPNKVIHKAFLLADRNEIETKISLYRPETKDGDPRVWIYSLSKFASANNVIAVIFKNENIYVINCSNTENFDYFLNSDLLGSVEEKKLSPIAEELLGKLRKISTQGFVQTITAGDTGIGMTLEKLLGIEANSSKEPDYKGIELKSKRTRSKKTKAKEQLFSKVPLWKQSPVTKAKDLINLRGYIDSDGSQALRHTISAEKPNSLGLYLEVDQENDLLKQMHIDAETQKVTHDVCWNISELKESLTTKHKETFWVYAKTNNLKGVDEAFHFLEATHTIRPSIDKFETLLGG